MLVSFETAKFSKERGFNEPCYNVYDINGDIYDSHYRYWQSSNTVTNTFIQEIIDKRKKLQEEHPDKDYSSDDCCTAPFQSELQKWFRDVHNLEILVKYKTDESGYFCIVYMKDGLVKFTSIIYKSYEEALEEGLKQALTLIK